MKKTKHLRYYPAHFFLEYRMWQTKVVVNNQNTRFMFNDFFENRSVCEIMWQNFVEPDRSQITIWSVRITCWVPKGTNTHSEYVILIAFILQQLLNDRASMLSSTYIVSLGTYHCILLHILTKFHIRLRILLVTHI
jgi:hypothetical protein